MNIELWTLGKERSKGIDQAIDEYTQRINRYLSFQVVTIDNAKIPKQLPKNQILLKEVELVLAKLNERDMLICLDEHGKSFTSVKFAEKMNQLLSQSSGRIIFLIGGSFGIHETLKSKAQMLLRLSDFTFPHQLVRLLFTEQLYRAFSILNNEKYHHE
ncbi:MAG: 23S rRNA (pseudouridine(1915)-N(3))-methyltransferase RlmH [Chitinophagaceae bacterium]|nr:23S rRNA (pseudouridine(1915)-N(3))-methyltransferase RlmH [Chitinophagaceae bacterium]